MTKVDVFVRWRDPFARSQFARRQKKSVGHVLQNLSVRDTATTMQVSAASVYMARHRISRLLKREVTKLKKKMV